MERRKLITMQKQIKITITREDFVAMLAEKGIELPMEQTVEIREDGEYGKIEFPLTVQWDESTYPKFNLNYALPTAQHQAIYDAYYGSSERITNIGVGKIPAIKVLRGFTMWGLKEAKEWVEYNFPG